MSDPNFWPEAQGDDAPLSLAKTLVYACVIACVIAVNLFLILLFLSHLSP